MIDSNTVPYGSFFTEKEHPVSIRMHSELYGDGCVFVPFEIRRRHLESSLNTVRTGMLHGAELSPVIAVDAAGYMDALMDNARYVGAANLVFMADGRLTGSNTHVSAFRDMMVPRAHGMGEAPMAIVFGTGYAARVAICALAPICSMLCVVSRNPDGSNGSLVEIERMLERMGAYGSHVETVGYSEAVTDPYDIVVNATPMGSGMNRCSPTHLDGRLFECTPRDGQVFVEFPIGNHRSAFLPSVDGVDSVHGLSIAAMAAADGYARLTSAKIGSRAEISTRYSSLADKLYSELV